MGIAHREQAASCFLFGYFAAESLILAEAGQQDRKNTKPPTRTGASSRC